MEHLRYLESQFLNDEFGSDIQFIIERDLKTDKIPAHKVILAAGSLILAKRFAEYRDMKKIEIENATPAAFKEFLFTFYSKFPEKNFTIVNAPEVLNLARTFQAVHCFKSSERFLLKNLSTEQMFFGFSIACEFALHDLKIFCQKQINENKRDTFVTSSFFGCTEDILYDILESITVNDPDDIKVVFGACMKWTEKQCILKSMDSGDMNVRRYMLGKCFNQIQSIVSKDGEFLNGSMNLYAGFFQNVEKIHIQNDEKQVEDNEYEMERNCAVVCNDTKIDLSATIFYNQDINQNEVVDMLEFGRFNETILSPQTWYANDPIIIELHSTKQIALNGIAFSTVTGMPRGKLCIGVRCDDGETILIEQQLNSKANRCEPRNFIEIENVVLEPYKDYVIKAILSKDTVYRSSRRVANTFNANDFTITFKVISRRDTFSHFFFNDIFN